MLKSPLRSCERALFHAPLPKHIPRPPRPNERGKALEPKPAASRSPQSATTRSSVSSVSIARRWLAALSKLAKGNKDNQDGAKNPNRLACHYSPSWHWMFSDLALRL